MKKSFLSRAALAALFSFLVLMCPLTVFAGSWEDGHTVYTENGKAVTGWKTIGSSKYYFSKDGKVLTGYQKIGKSYYYFSKSAKTKGAMVKDKWVKIKGAKRYFTKNGKQVKQNKYICLTFDDGPGIYTESLLKTLKAYDAHATFFVTGENASRYPKVLKSELAAGCEIGNHSYNHPNFANISSSAIQSQINRTNTIVKKATGVKPKVVRVPYGSISSKIRSAIKSPYIYWSIDTLDWKTRNANKTISATMKGAKNGSIVLMHDIHKPSVQAAKALVPMLIKKGYKLVTVSEMAEIRNKSLKKGTVYFDFYK